MIRWADKLYLSEDLIKKKKRIIKSIENNNLNFETYVIMLASNTDNLFDIINTNELQFSYYLKKDNYILGIAGSRGLAMLLVKDMIEEIYNKTGGFLVREYFKE
ncbi:MAG: hypothetical protein K0S61_177 [Anaerocolumna sp.]|jgi:hypothetical protein|nr:hypothetical protein [Anaerocolumna sp.]